jgi:hypothetical protein
MQRYEWEPLKPIARILRDRDDVLERVMGELDNRMKRLVASSLRRGEFDPDRPGRMFLPAVWSYEGITASLANTPMDLPPGSHTVWHAPDVTDLRRIVVQGNDPVLAGRAKVVLVKNGNRVDAANAALTPDTPSVAATDISAIEGVSRLEPGDTVGLEIEADADLVLATPPASYDIRALLEVVA